MKAVMKRISEPAYPVVHWSQIFDEQSRGAIFRLKLEEALKKESPFVVIDLSGVESVDSVEIGNLVAAQFRCDKRGVRLLIENMSAPVSKTLAGLSMLDLFARC